MARIGAQIGRFPSPGWYWNQIQLRGTAVLDNFTFNITSGQGGFRTDEPLYLSATPGQFIVNPEYTWVVRDRYTDNLEAIGFGAQCYLNVGTASYYNITLTVRTATDQYVKKFVNISVLPPKPETEDAHILIDGDANLITFRASFTGDTETTQALGDGYFLDHEHNEFEGLRICVRGDFTAYIAALNLLGTNDSGWSSHVMIYKEKGSTNVNQTGVSASDIIQISGCRYVIVDGYNDDRSIGWWVYGPEGCNYGLRAENTVGYTNTHVMGMGFIKTGASKGVSQEACISFVPPVNSTYNATTWEDVRTSITGCYFTGTADANTWAEMIYKNYTDDTAQSGNIPMKSFESIISGNVILQAGNDGIQVSSTIDVDISFNFVYRCGLGGFSTHQNGISWNEGNTGVCYGNFIADCKQGVNGKVGRTPWRIFTEETAPPDNTYIFRDNIFIEGNPTSSGQVEGSYHYFQVNNTTNTATVVFKWINNTTICNKHHFTFQFASGGFRIPDLTMVNNIVVKTGSSGVSPGVLAYAGAGTTPTDAVINNLVRNFSNYADIGFVDVGARNYRVTDFTSPAFVGPPSPSDRTQYLDGENMFDADGYPVESNYFGAYSSLNARTVAPSYPDPVAAEFSSGPTITNITDTTATIEWLADKDSVLLFARVENNGVAPTADQLEALNFGQQSGALLQSDGVAEDGSLTGMVVDTAYDVYVMAVTPDHVRGPITKLEFSTVSDSIAPVLSSFRIKNGEPTRVYCNSDGPINGSTVTGFSFAGFHGITVSATGFTDSGGTTDHYFTINQTLVALDRFGTIAYAGGSNIQDLAGNALASFGATAITNEMTATEININLMYGGVNGPTPPWDNCDIDNVTVRQVDANLTTTTGSASGKTLNISDQFEANVANSVTPAGGPYVTNANVLGRGIATWQGGQATGAFVIGGFTAAQAVSVVYAVYTNGGGNTPGTGTVTVNGASVGFNSTTYTEYIRRNVVADGSGNVTITMTSTQSNTVATMEFIIISY